MESKRQRETTAIAAGSKTDCVGGQVCNESILAEAAGLGGTTAVSSRDEEQAKFRNKVVTRNREKRKRKRAGIAARFKKITKVRLGSDRVPENQRFNICDE
jgi:hypothetical protein